MEDKTQQVESLLEKAQQYGKTGLELLKLKAVDRSSEAISVIGSIWAVVIPAVLFFILCNIGLALWIGEAIGSVYLGFFIMAGFFLLVAAVVFACRIRFIKRPLKNFIIRQLLK